MDLDQSDRICECRFIQNSSYYFPVTNVKLEYIFDTLGFLWLYRHSPPCFLYLLEKLVDGLSGERMRPPPLRSIITTTILEVMIGINISLNMGLATAVDVCDGNFKSKNIRVHGNATIVKQTGPKLVYSAEQQKALEMMTIVGKKCPITQQDGL